MPHAPRPRVDVCDSLLADFSAVDSRRSAAVSEESCLESLSHVTLGPWEIDDGTLVRISIAFKCLRNRELEGPTRSGGAFPK